VAYVDEWEIGHDSCPYCKIEKALALNSFMVKHDDLIKEWDYIKNYLLCNPNEIFDTYSDGVWWNCDICGTKYLMSPKQKDILST
jgi:hypothetical protein